MFSGHCPEPHSSCQVVPTGGSNVRATRLGAITVRLLASGEEGRKEGFQNESIVAQTDHQPLLSGTSQQVLSHPRAPSLPTGFGESGYDEDFFLCLFCLGGGCWGRAGNDSSMQPDRQYIVIKHGGIHGRSNIAAYSLLQL
ncbi:hypothetical protein L209DRAFT_211997 [Thermothelomyces heterothallicus CBS 203.75]